mmetsp:Transcript_16752/g.29341  ORF Transcript_16752/g.29341 Transcript_16752/m.29341 type:complete len:709 (+) Transcript_16752:68-2194(+)|eukprot:CAMPEP_0197659246 /NCGR_PEP_ID=MMETSP1338-20131121/46814_1 /TAXON_ID=43686 ORGANISM="Pelagodinium beii, Strain RCC1491" /NCGR_SAMPLE_ID=MMETSP1338 /ASSEMBLY_ACC=CAM_ASM_000754 /LENGTH=708 /DNA_ID=CAMNT_0043236077 /DNA_START=68 /DNA_END=2194 /DNA_ORIENTATION=-
MAQLSAILLVSSTLAACGVTIGPEKHSETPLKPEVKVLHFTLEPTGQTAEATEHGNKVDVEILHTNSEMVPNDDKATSIGTTTTTTLSRGTCSCKLGQFYDWRSSKCLDQKVEHYECGFFPTRFQHRVCKDGLRCETSKELTIQYGNTRRPVATCVKCEEADNCTSGEARHEAECVREGDLVKIEQEVKEVEAEESNLETLITDNHYEAWGGKEGNLSHAEPLSEGEVDPLVPFGRAEPKMCISVQVTIPQLKLTDKQEKKLPLELPEELVLEAEAANMAHVRATAQSASHRSATVAASANATAKYHATKTAASKFTATETEKAEGSATYTAKHTSEAVAPVENTGYQAKVKTSHTVETEETSKATAEATAKASKTASSEGVADIEITLSQEATAVAEATATATAEYTAAVNKSAEEKAQANIRSMTSVSKIFTATATAKAFAETRVCIAADQARRLLDAETMKKYGRPFAEAVYRKAETQAYETARDQALEVAMLQATSTAQTAIDKDIEVQTEKYAKEHQEELKVMAVKIAKEAIAGHQKLMQDNVKTEAEKKSYDAALALAKVEAQKLADAKASKEAEDKAVEKAKAAAEAKATEGLKELAIETARKKAEKAAEDKAQAQADKIAKEEAIKMAKDAAKSAAEKMAQAKAKAQAKLEAEKLASSKAENTAEKLIKHGANQAEDILSSKREAKKDASKSFLEMRRSK